MHSFLFACFLRPRNRSPQEGHCIQSDVSSTSKDRMSRKSSWVLLATGKLFAFRQIVVRRDQVFR